MRLPMLKIITNMKENLLIILFAVLMGFGAFCIMKFYVFAEFNTLLSERCLKN
jgi:hypothetical protein